MSPTKQEIRREIERRQGRFDLADRQRAGFAVASTCNTLIRRYLQCEIVMCYVSHRDETPTHDIIRACLASGRRVCVPLVDHESKTMAAFELKNFATDLEPGYAGILEPRDTCRRPVSPDQIDVQFVPGTAYDQFGHRLGRGGAYYDRYLAQCNPDTVKVGLAFSWQMIQEIPVEAHDVRMDLIVTEENILSIREDLFLP